MYKTPFANSVTYTKVSVSKDQTDGEMVLKFNINVTAGDGTVHSLVTDGQSILVTRLLLTSLSPWWSLCSSPIPLTHPPSVILVSFFNVFLYMLVMY